VKSSQFAVVISGFWLLFFFFAVLESPINQVLSSEYLASLGLRSAGPFIHLRSEYQVGEQLSKYYLFVVMLISILSYRIVKDPLRLKMSIGFLILGLTMYLAESNMILEIVQPIFGLLIVGCVVYFLLKGRLWLVLFLLLLGSFLISNAVIIDLLHEQEVIKPYVPEQATIFLNALPTEGRLEVIGIACVTLAVIISFLDVLAQFTQNNVKGTFWILFTSGMITVGNGFLHFQYRPRLRLVTLALLLTMIGFLGLMYTNKYVNKQNMRLTLVNEDSFYLFIFFFFVVLPTVFGRNHYVTSVFLWLPTMTLLALYLYYHHPHRRLFLQNHFNKK